MKWKDAPFNKVQLLDHLKATFGSEFHPQMIKDLSEKVNNGSADGIKFHLSGDMARSVNAYIKKGAMFNGVTLTGGFAAAKKTGKTQKPVIDVLLRFIETCYDPSFPGGYLNLSSFLDRFMLWEPTQNLEIKIDIDWHHDNFLANLSAAINKNKLFKEVALLNLNGNPIVSLEFMNNERCPFTALKQVSLCDTLIYYIPELASLGAGNAGITDLHFSSVLGEQIFPKDLAPEDLLKLIKSYFPSIKNYNGAPVNVLTAPAPELRKECGKIMKHAHRILEDKAQQPCLVKKNSNNHKLARDFIQKTMNSFGCGSHAIYQICRAISPVFQGSIRIADYAAFPVFWSQIAAYSAQLMGSNSFFDFKTLMACFLNLEKLSVTNSRVEIEPFNEYGDIEAHKISILGEGWIGNKDFPITFAGCFVIVPHDAAPGKASPEFMPMEISRMILYISRESYDILNLVYLTKNLITSSDLTALYNDEKNGKSATKIHDVIRSKLPDLKWSIE